MGRINFPDEVLFGQALIKAASVPAPVPTGEIELISGYDRIRHLVAGYADGYLNPGQVQDLLDAAGITRIRERVVNSQEEAVSSALTFGFPVVMKVVGPVHKTDVGGVLLNLANHEEVSEAFQRLMSINDATGVLIQPMLKGRELFVGAKRELPFGHLVVIGLGGIFIEVLHDVQSGLAPLTAAEVSLMISRLKGGKLLQGVRGQAGVSIGKWIELILAVSALVAAAPEIAEMDLNPVMGLSDRAIAVDARIRIEK
jgi:acetyltransferase